jgi:signal transduction histidine kinase
MLLALQTAAVVALVVVALEAVALVVVLRGQHAASLSLMQQTTRHADDVTDPPSGAWLTIRTPTSQASSPGLPAGFPVTADIARAASTGKEQISTVHVGGTDYLVVTAPRRSGVVVQGVLDLTADQSERDRLAAALTVSGVLGLLLAAGAGVLLAWRAMRPTTEALAIQRRFVADASHELRTPLTLLSTRAQLLRRDLRSGAEQATLVEEVDGLVGDAHNLGQVLEDLLVAADPRTHQRKERVDVGRLAGEVAASATAAAAAEGVQVRCSIQDMTPASSGPIVLDASGTALRRALTALVDNAVRHARTSVVVAVRRTPSHVVVDVVDDGPGIQADVLPRLFDRYETAQPSGSTQRGYGLGLALVSEIATGHGGTVTARNVESPTGDGTGSGAVLELRLPLRG